MFLLGTCDSSITSRLIAAKLNARNQHRGRSMVCEWCMQHEASASCMFSEFDFLENATTEILVDKLRKDIESLKRQSELGYDRWGVLEKLEPHKNKNKLETTQALFGEHNGTSLLFGDPQDRSESRWLFLSLFLSVVSSSQRPPRQTHNSEAERWSNTSKVRFVCVRCYGNHGKSKNILSATSRIAQVFESS